MRNIFSVTKNIAFLVTFLFIQNSLTIKNLQASRLLTDEIVNEVIDDEDSEFYILDSGDSLFIEFHNLIINIDGMREFTGTYKVSSEGTINLPELGKISVLGLTIKELDDFLTNEYKNYIFNPSLNIYIQKYRAVSFYLGGAVKKPGLYSFAKNQNFDLEGSIIDDQSNNFKVKLFDALRMGEGLNKNADLSNIEIFRKNSNSNGGGKIFTSVNFLELLKNGDQKVNIRIFDGDYIKVNTSEKAIKEQISLINKSNLTPDKINVYIIGNVNGKGAIQIKTGSNLYEAIAAAGGAPSQVGKIELLRFGEDGSPEKKIINYVPNSFETSKNNPEILDGDIITIRRNILGKTTYALQEISSPILSSYGLYSIFN